MNDEELDIQIRGVLDVEPSAEQLARLKCFWMEQSQAVDRRQRKWRRAALAAAIVGVAAVSVWQLRSGPLQQGHFSNRAAPGDPIVNQPVLPRHFETTAASELQPDENSFAAGRPPTAYERFVFSIGRREPIDARAPTLVATLDKMIDELVRDPDADAGQFVFSTDLPADDAERILLRRLARSTDARKHAVLRLLAECGSQRSQLELLRLGRRVEFRDAVVTTLEQIVGIEQLPRVLDETVHTGLRMTLILRLLTANSEAALRGYLSLVEKSGTRSEALASAEELTNPPVGELLAYLDDEDESVRLSAAVVLGHINGPEVAKLLVDRVTQNPEGKVEAWIAILACRGAVAEEFLAYAIRQPQLLAHINSARVHWARIVN
jgi:hypothetical protein